MADSTQERSSNLFRWAFLPSTALMGRLPYSLKFVVIGGLAFGALLTLLGLQFKARTEQIEFNANEVLGIEYIEPTMAFLHQVQRRRVLEAAVLAGETASSSDLKQATTLADAEVARID